MSARLRLRKLRTLDLVAPSRQGRPAFVASASGLVGVGEWFYVVADDELHIAAFRGTAPGRLLRLFEGKLPHGKKGRKKRKPDLEVLTLLPPGDLLALPSGSRSNRVTGARIPLGRDGLIRGEPGKVDFEPLYDKLSKVFSELNIEGAAVTHDRLLLFQRGNGPSGENACVALDLREVLSRLRRESCVTAREIREIRPFDLGQVKGFPLGFTDACTLADGRVAFVAVAEARASTTEDGPCLESIFGLIGRNGELEDTRKLRGPSGKPLKTEGLWVARGRAWFVTDADDPEIPSILYEGLLK